MLFRPFFALSMCTLVATAAACGDDTGAGGAGGSGAGGRGGGATGGGGAGGSVTQNCDPPSGAIPALTLTEIAPPAAGWEGPALVVAAPGDKTRLFVLTLRGEIWIIKDGVANADPFLDLSSEIQYGGEQGLLGLAFHPDYANNGRFFVHFSQPGSGDTEIAEYARMSPDLASPTKIATILTEPQPFENHNGGAIEFGPDGLLYVFLGDGGSGGDPMGNGQDLQTRLGKILRLDVDSQTPFAPAGNYPGALPEIWAIGVRNPWRASFDPCTNDLYIGDVGQNEWEEIDVVTPGDSALNFGWNVAEANHCYGGGSCDLAPFVAPVYEYPHVPGEFDGGASVNGGYVYRGSAIPALRGRYFFSDFVREEVFSFVYAGGQATDIVDHTAELGTSLMTSFGMDADGELYITTFEAVYKITAP